jgi:hypothetical protein
LSILGLDEFLFPLFTSLNILRDPTSKRLALRLKTQYQETEHLPLIQFYLSSDTKGSEKKISGNLHDCFLRLFNKVNTLKIRRSRGDEKGSITGVEPTRAKRFGAPPFDQMCLSFIPKERDFSMFYDNSYLYMKAFRYLFDCNLYQMSQILLKACQQETHLALTSRDSLKFLPLRHIILIHKLLSTEEQINKELQDGLLRIILLRKGGSLDETLVKLAFIYKLFQAEENFTPHLLFLAELNPSKVEFMADELNQQASFVNIVLEMVEIKKYQSYFSLLPEFEEFAASQFNQGARSASDNQTVNKNSQGGNRSGEKDKEGSQVAGSGVKPILRSSSGLGVNEILSGNNQKCPTEFYSSYFAINDLGCMVEQLMPVERSYFEGYIEYSLTSWVKGLIGDKNIDRMMNHGLELSSLPDSSIESDYRDAGGVKSLTDDFFAVTQSYVVELDGAGSKEAHEQRDDRLNRDEEVPVMQASIAAINPSKTMSELEHMVDFYAVKQFAKRVSTLHMIRVFRTEDVMINGSRNVCPDYLKEEGIALYEGLIMSNRQKCNIFRVNISYLDHLKRIWSNLEFMNMYSPVVVKYLGLIFDENYDGSSPFTVYFVVDHWDSDLMTHCKQNFPDSTNNKELRRDQFELVYRLLYLTNIILKTGMLPPLLNPQTIVISKNGYPMILIPFFAASYLSPKSYLDNVFKSSSVTDLQYFIAPQSDKILEASTLILQMKSTQNFSLSKVTQPASDHQQTLLSNFLSSCCKCILLILSGQPPLTSLVSKSTTAQQLQSMLATSSKTAPVLAKIWAGLKKKTPAFLKTGIEELSNCFSNPTSAKIGEVLELIKSELGKDVDTFCNFVTFNLAVVSGASFVEESSGVSRNLDKIGLDESPEAPNRKIIYLPCKITFNGYIGQGFIQSAKIYSGNNLVCSISLENSGGHLSPGANHPYLVEYHLEESKSLLLRIAGNQLQEVTYLIKNPTALQGKNSATPAEKRLVFGKFFDNSWVQNEHIWLNILKTQFSGDCEEIRSKAFKLEGSFPKNTATGILYSDRSQSLHELFAQLYFCFNKLCMIRSFVCPHIVDFFGNIVNWNPYPPIPDSNLAKMSEQQASSVPKASAHIAGSDWLIIRSQVPTRMVKTILFNNAISPSAYFKTDLSQFTLRARCTSEDRHSTANIVTAEQYLNLVRELSVVDAPEAPKYRAIVTYTEGGQFWGWCKHSRPLQGKFFSTEQDFNTVCDDEIYEGQLCASSRNFKYLGYLEKNLPQYFGEYYLNNQLVYRGGIERGVPDGKGQLFNTTGHLMFDGFLQGGFPVSGVFYKLPRMFVGKFSIPYKSNYRFSFKKIDLFIKSLQYESMMSSFSLHGEIRNYTSDVKLIRGYFSHDNTLLKGDFYLRSQEGKVYIGEMKESRKEGMGLMILPTGQTILGRWKGNTINGVFRCPTKSHEQNRPIGADARLVESKSPVKLLGSDDFQHEGQILNNSRPNESQTKVESMKKPMTFNKIPVEVKGHFEIRGESLLLMESGSIRFEDGSVYTGGILNNKMSGYGSLKYSNGDQCEGIWKNNQLTGLGFYSTDSFIYEGQFKHSIWHGFGKLSFKYENRIIKGEWESGRLKYALLDEFEPNTNYLQIDRITIRVDDESNFFKSGIAELQGTAHVLFKDRIATGSKDVTASPSHKPEQISSMIVMKDIPNKSDDISEQALKSKDKHSQAQLSSHQFFGIFTRLDEKSAFEGFPRGQIAALGMIVKGTEVIFTGLADYEFSKFFGVKYDHDTQTELRGYFNSHLKLNGIGVQLMMGSEYIGNFRKNHKHGLLIKVKDGYTVFVGEYTDDVKNGYGMRFQEEIALSSVGELKLGTTPRSQLGKIGYTGSNSLGVKEGVKGILIESSYGKLKRIFYALE